MMDSPAKYTNLRDLTNEHRWNRESTNRRETKEPLQTHATSLLCYWILKQMIDNNRYSVLISPLWRWVLTHAPGPKQKSYLNIFDGNSTTVSCESPTIWIWLSHSLAGWWFFPTPLKNDGVKVSWEYGTIPNCFWTVIKNSMVPVTNQPLDPWNFLGEISNTKNRPEKNPENSDTNSPWRFLCYTCSYGSKYQL